MSIYQDGSFSTDSDYESNDQGGNVCSDSSSEDSHFVRYRQFLGSINNQSLQNEYPVKPLGADCGSCGDDDKNVKTFIREKKEKKRDALLKSTIPIEKNNENDSQPVVETMIPTETKSNLPTLISLECHKKNKKTNKKDEEKMMKSNLPALVPLECHKNKKNKKEKMMKSNLPPLTPLDCRKCDDKKEEKKRKMGMKSNLPPLIPLQTKSSLPPLIPLDCRKCDDKKEEEKRKMGLKSNLPPLVPLQTKSSIPPMIP
jgi:hypothetical protein